MNPSPGFVIVTTTVENDAQADALAAALVGARLAACVQCLPIRSVYRWQGRVEKAGEVLLLAKTAARLVPELVAAIRRRHPYQIPEVVAWPITDGLPDYLAWIADETRYAQPCVPAPDAAGIDFSGNGQ